MQQVLQTVISPLLIYRLAFGVAAIFIYADGYLADARIDLPTWVIGFRELSILACLALLLLTTVSEFARRHVGWLALATALLINAYSGAVAFATSMGINEVLGCLMVLCVSSTVFHEIRLTVANLIGSSMLYLAMALPVSEPVVAYDKFALSVIVFASFFLILMVSNLHARSRQARSEQAANAWFDNSADALIYGDVATETVKRANPMALALFETAEPQNIIELLVGGILNRDPNRRRAELLADAASAESMEDVVEFTTAAGNHFWGALSLRKLRIAGETLTLVRISDVSTQVAHEEALEAARVAAEAAVHTRTRFLANMSHEIRTPMNGVIGMASLLQETPLDEQQQNFLKTIRTSGEALLSIINEILDFSKIDADQVQLEQKVFDLRECAQEAIELITPAALAKDLSLTLEVDSSLVESYRGDVNRIRQVLGNLLANAVKFTAAGGVTLRVSAHQQSGAANVCFDIEDTGIGVPASKQQHLFDPFSQADASTTRQYGGTGLGLSISKRLAELMSGDITVTSSPGAGSCFSFTLHVDPVSTHANTKPADDPDAPLEPLPTERLSFLVAEDNLVNQKVALQMLKQLGVDTDVVNNGREAIEALQQRDYDVVFMDVQMPEVDGLEASSIIRQNVESHQPYIIAMTANAMVEDQQACFEAGMNDFVAKPVRLEDLHHALSRALDAGPRALAAQIGNPRSNSESPFPQI